MRVKHPPGRRGYALSMERGDRNNGLDELRKLYPEKFLPEDKIFSRINRGDRIFIGTACAEPQYLVNALVNYVSSYPKAFFDAEVIHVWTLGVAPYADGQVQVELPA